MFRVARGWVDLERRVLHADEGPVELTRMEVAALERLHAAGGKVVSREELLAVWGYAAGSTSQAIHVAMRRLRGKIERDPADPAHLKTVAGVGWVLEPLPDPPTSDLVGRDALLAELCALAVREPLVLLLGPGGIGKTALARVVAERLGGRFVDASAAARAADLEAAVGEVVGAPLLVLDNLEQLGDEATGPILAWRQRGVRLVLTSRVKLAVDARVVEVGPLTDADGIELLLRRAPGLQRPDTTLPALVRALEGNPLCLELAAARTRVLAPAELLRRLVDRFAVLRSPERALAASIEASDQLLAPALREALGELAVFRGAFRPQSAEHVLGDGGLDALQGLVEASLVHRQGERLALYVAVREWVEGRRPPSARARQRHAELVSRIDPNRTLPEDTPELVSAARWALDAGEDALAARCAFVLGVAATYRRIPDAAAIVEAALPRAHGDDRVRLLRILAQHRAQQGAFDAAFALLDSARPSEPMQVGLVHETRGWLLQRVGRLEDAEREMLDAAKTFEDAGLRTNLATAWMNAAAIARDLGRTEEARQRLERTRDLARELGNPRLEGTVLTNLAAAARDPVEATALSRDAIALFDRVGDDMRASRTRLNLAHLLLEAGALDEADAQAARAVADLEALDRRSWVRGLGARGAVARARGAWDEARRWLLQAEEAVDRVGDPLLGAVIRRELAIVLRHHGETDRAEALFAASAQALTRLGNAAQLALTEAARADPRGG